MNTEQQELWNRLAAFELDDPAAALPFSGRLARDNGWTPAHARRVVDEYRRFLFLAVAAGHPVTPSEDVDQAWHLHLVYTRSYWQDLCQGVLGRPLHHGPTRGGRAEGAKFHDWYARTRESYERFFGAPPPPDIWPDAERRFGDAPHFVRLNTRRCWILPKPRRETVLRLGTGIAAVALLMGCEAATRGGGWNVFNWYGNDFLHFFVILGLVVFPLVAWWRALDRRTPAGASDEPLTDPYEVAYLAGGPVRALNAAVASLSRRDRLTVGSERVPFLTAVGDDDPSLPPLEQAVRSAAGPGTRLNRVRQRVQPELNALRDSLAARGLLPARRLNPGRALLAAVPVVVGIIKIVVGVSRDRPVGYLVALTIASAVLAVVLGFRPLRRTRRGDSLVRELRDQNLNLRRTLESPDHPNRAPGGWDPAFPLLIGVYGLGVLATTAQADVARRLQQGTAASASGGDGCGSSWDSDSSSSSGCSSGGDGGGGCGGGGCGGCGGGGD